MADLGRILIIPKGEYDSTFPYESLDLVRYDTKSWISKRPNIGVTPTEGDDWMLVNRDGNQWFRGKNLLSGKNPQTVDTTALGEINEKDNYVDTDTGFVYHCTRGGLGNTDWAYDFTLTGGGGGESGATILPELEDVSINAPTNGQGLVYNSTTQKWENKAVASDVKVDDTYVTKNTSNEITLTESVTDKLSEIDEKEDKHVQLVASCSGVNATVTNETYIGTDYLLEEYIDNPNAYVKSRSISGNTLTLEFSDTVTSCVVIATKKGV